MAGGRSDCFFFPAQRSVRTWFLLCNVTKLCNINGASCASLSLIGLEEAGRSVRHASYEETLRAEES